MTKTEWSPETIQTLLERRGLDAEACARWMELARRESFARNHLTSRDGSPWQVRPYQAASLESRAVRKVHCDGRDVGKTAEIAVLKPSWLPAIRKNWLFPRSSIPEAAI